MTASPPWRGGYWENRSRERSERAESVRKRRAERAAPHGFRSLEEATHKPHDCPEDFREGVPCAEGQVGVKVTEYPDGFRVVAYQSKGRAVGGGGVSTADKPQDESRSPPAEQRSESSLGRSRALVAHRARCLGPVAMWTFTKRGKFESADHVWASWRLFTQACRRRYGIGFRYVAVPELHADGETWHLHVLVDRIYMVESLRVLWARALGGTGLERGSETVGNVDAKSLRGRGFGARRAAGYIAKYVGKGFGGGCAGRRLFSASGGLDPVRIRRWALRIDTGIVDGANRAREWLCEHYGVGWFPQKFVWASLWGCSIGDVIFPKTRSVA